jgi:hypothetical protein
MEDGVRDAAEKKLRPEQGEGVADVGQDLGNGGVSGMPEHYEGCGRHVGHGIVRCRGARARMRKPLALTLPISHCSRRSIEACPRFQHEDTCHDG